jgi:tyrosinase
VGVRKNQARLTDAEWRDFLAALDGLHAAGRGLRYDHFVRVHVDGMTTVEGMRWGVHTMPEMGMLGRNFLAWHRQYLVQFERALEQIRPNVAIPYWNWTRNRAIPAPLRSASLLRRWRITRSRNFDASMLPTRRNLNALNANTSFSAFQAELEALHGLPHNAVGGTMATAASPADPLFWLHHAFIDRLWARWQESPQGVPPSNIGERLLPRRAFGVRMFGDSVSSVLDIGELGYSYS